jgi:hypothetical protein
MTLEETPDDRRSPVMVNGTLMRGQAQPNMIAARATFVGRKDGAAYRLWTINDEHLPYPRDRCRSKCVGLVQPQPGSRGFC